MASTADWTAATPMAAHSDPFGAGRACRHPITERAQIGGTARGYPVCLASLAAWS